MGNTPGHELTARAENILGGVAPEVKTFVWKSGGNIVGSNQEIYLLESSDVGNIITCDITVAEPDGSNPETRPATYAKVIEIAGTIDTPEVLAPADGAGSGDARYLISDAITEVEGGGVDRCETELIESVDDTTDAPNIILTFPNSNGFDCFEPGDVVQDPDITVISKDADAVPPTITVDGGDWFGTDENNDPTQNKSEIWSDLVQGVVDTQYGATAKTGFDGTIGATYTEAIKPATGDVDGLFMDFGTLTAVKVKFHLYYGNNQDGGPTVNEYFYVNDVEIGRSFPVGSGDIVQEYTVPGGVLRNVRWKYNSNNSSSGYAYIKAIEVDDGTGYKLLVDPSGQDKLTKQTPYDTKLTVAGPKDLADMTNSTFMSDGSGASGPYSQTPYKLVTTDIESVDEVSIQFTGLASDWTKTDITNVAHFPSSTGPFDSADNNYVWANDTGASDNIANPDTAKLEIDLAFNIAAGSSIEIAWQGNAYNYSRTVAELLDVNGNVVASSPFTHAGDGADTATKVSAGETTGVATKLQLRVDTTKPFPTRNELLGGFAGLWVNGVKYVAKTYEYTTLTFPGAVSTNPDLRYFKSGDVVGIEETTELPGDQGSSNVGGNAANAFDGNLDSSCSMPGSEASNLRWKSPDATKLRITFEDNGTSGQTLQVLTGSAYDQNPGSWVAGTPNTTVNGNQITINSRGKITADFEITNNQTDFLISCPTSGGMKIYNIAVFVGEDVKVISTGYPDSNTMVVDGGEWLGSDGSGTADGATVVEYQTYGGEGEVVNVNTDDNTILLKDLPGTDRNNRWIIGATDTSGNAGNSGETGDAANATDFFVAGPDVVDLPLLTADVELLSSLFATTPDGADSLKNIVWELNGATQDAGLTNPYKPTLSTNTTYTVRVKHQGNSLPDSAWSTSTTFTTGATRNLYTYYQDRIATLVSRIEALENP